MAQLLDGTRIAAEIRAEVGAAVRDWNHGEPPGLTVILAGNNPASEVYVRGKIRACAEVGIRSEQLLPPQDVTTSQLLETIEELNLRNDVDGILVQLPLPRQVDSAAVLLAVSPEKDVDGFHPVNVGRLVTGRPGLRPCTPAGILEMLRRSRIEVAGREAAVAGRSDIVGKPTAMLLLQENATVTICHSRTRNLAEVCRRADILIAAVGKPAFLGAEHIREGALVVDVGINRLTERADVEKYFPGNESRMQEWLKRGSTLIGDVDPRAAHERASHFAPVPGGVGPLTIAMLMANTLTAARMRRGDLKDGGK